tara:strand:- start:1288 stop:1536 length:249 start_codon:yes stop_codon:yes gene_type:complete
MNRTENPPVANVFESYPPAMYFNCNSKLVDSFKQVYPDILEYSGNRAIVFHRANPVPVQAVKHCIATALQYHKLKHLPLLGM